MGTAFCGAKRRPAGERNPSPLGRDGRAVTVDGQNPEAKGLATQRAARAEHLRTASPMAIRRGNLSKKTERIAETQKDVKMKDDPNYLLKIKEIKSDKTPIPISL